MRGRPRVVAAAVAFAGLLGASSCGSDDSEPVAATNAATMDAPSSESAVSGDVTVFAAASLTDAFTEIGDAFMVEHPDATVRFSFAASSALVAQIGEGAPSDVFASADLSNMAKLTDAGDNATEPVVFAANVAEIIVGTGNPEQITSLADLANEDLIVIQCAPQAPCGSYAMQVLENAGVTVTPQSFEENVRGVVTKVTLGEADAGIVYATDVAAAGVGTEGVAIPADLNVVAEYPIAVTGTARNVDGAHAFVDFVLSEQGQAILASYGFLVP